MDAKILEARLLTRESALVTSSVSKCASKLQSYVLALAAASSTHYKDEKNSKEESAAGSEDIALVSTVDESKESLIRELSLYRFEMVQVLASAAMCERELSEYVRMEGDIERDITAAEKHIEELTEQLREHKSVRRHKEEVEMLAKLVNTLPAGSVVDKDIRKAQEALDKLRAESAATDNKVKMRSKQFQVLLQCLSDLQRSVEEEEEQQRAMAALVEEANAAASGTATGTSGGAEEEEEQADSDAEEAAEDRAGRARDLDLDRAQKKARIAEEEDLQEDGAAEGSGGGSGTTESADGEEGESGSSGGDANAAQAKSTASPSEGVEDGEDLSMEVQGDMDVVNDNTEDAPQ